MTRSRVYLINPTDFTKSWMKKLGIDRLIHKLHQIRNDNTHLLKGWPTRGQTHNPGRIVEERGRGCQRLTSPKRRHRTRVELCTIVQCTRWRGIIRRPAVRSRVPQVLCSAQVRRPIYARQSVDRKSSHRRSRQSAGQVSSIPDHLIVVCEGFFVIIPKHRYSRYRAGNR